MRISSLSLTVLWILADPANGAFVPSRPSLTTCSTTTTTTSVSSAKDGYRARIEANLEDMMDNDWRYFRARLVMQEAMEQEAQQGAAASDAEGRQQKQQPQHAAVTAAITTKAKAAAAAASTTNNNDKAQHERLGELFADAISNIFSKNSKTATSSSSSSAKDAKDANGARRPLDPILDGDSIAGLLPRIANDLLEDPFISEGELPVLLSPPVLDKQRWAHPISHIEPGCVLLASEKLAGAFRQAVILIIDHNDAAGSLGIVINRPMKGDLFQIASSEGDSSSSTSASSPALEKPPRMDTSLKLTFKDATVSYGGPVMPDEYTILHGFGAVEGAKKVAPGVFVGGSEELMEQVRLGQLRPRDTLFVKGHAAWVPNQLATEVNRGVWYVASTSKDFVLRHAKATKKKEEGVQQWDDLWLDILTCMGGKYAQVAEQFVGTTKTGGDQQNHRNLTP